MEHNKPNIPDLNYRSGLRYAMGKTVNYLKQGIGIPERGFCNGESPYIHDRNILTRYVGIINDFKDTALVGVKTINKIAICHIETYFNNLLANGANEKVIKVNASALIKFFEALNHDDLIAYINDKILMNK